jgi:energy-coupling factor transport system permease protein
MHKVAPLTKIILITLVSLWAMLLDSLTSIAILAGGMAALFPLSAVPAKSYKALGGLSIFALLIAGMQYAFGASIEFSLLIALRMMIMTGSFILLFATTRIQDLTAALVRQMKIPHEYAFMFTATLRFVPDFFAEIKAIQEAQACRGYSGKGNHLKRLVSFLAVVQPLVLKAITRSETMAMSLELRGFSCGLAGGYGASIALAVRDYAALSVMAVTTAVVVFSRLGA